MQKTCWHQNRTLSRWFPGYIDYGLYNWYTYTQTDIPVKLHQNGLKYNFSNSCQKWTWVLSQIPRTRFQCYWTQFVPSRPWSHIATNHKLRQQGFLNCRNLWLSLFVTVQNTTSQMDFKITEVILRSAENMFTSKSDHFKMVSWVHRLWAL